MDDYLNYLFLSTNDSRVLLDILFKKFNLKDDNIIINISMY